MTLVREPAIRIPTGNVLVLGAGASGLAAARFLARRDEGGVLVADTRAEGRIERAEALRAAGARLHAGGHPPDLLEGVALVVTSPGIPPSAPVLAAADRAGIPVWGELELGYRALGEPAERVVAVTGTKGKSTVVALLAGALHREGIPAVAGGNFGIPLTEFATPTDPDSPSGQLSDQTIFVVETSSFQLARISRFRARVGVLLAVTEDHLDWHPDLDHYRRSKARLFANQRPSDWAVYDGGNETATRIALTATGVTGARALRFGCASAGPGAQVVMESGPRGRALLAGDGPLTPLAGLGSLRIPGAHARRNLTAAAAAGSRLGVGRKALDAAARSFEGMPHALEEVGLADGVRFVDDSRATTIVATLAALEALGESDRALPIGLILGGVHKGGRFRDLEGHLGDAAGVWAIGASRDRIANAIGSTPVTRCESLEDAVQGAFEAMRPAGGTVLLSPGCSSFDQFSSYAERGRRFAGLARRLGARGGEA